MSNTLFKPHCIGIIGAMEQEIDLLRAQLQQPESHTFGQGIVIYTGTLHDKEIVLCLSGIGKVNAAIATTLLIEHFSPDCIINTGSAGGIGKNLKVGDVVIGSEISHHDADVTAFGYVYGQLPKQPARFAADTDLTAAAEYAARAFGKVQIVQGLIVSGDQFVHDSNKISHIRSHFADAQAVEMEAAAIAQTCYRLNKPFVIIRAISDSADEKAETSFEVFLETASKHSAQMVLQLIQTL